VKAFFTQIGINTIGGFGINMVITRVLPKLLILPTAVRIPARLLIFATPFAITFDKLSKHI
jgi:hypothetical protein